MFMWFWTIFSLGAPDLSDRYLGVKIEIKINQNFLPGLFV